MTINQHINSPLEHHDEIYSSLRALCEQPESMSVDSMLTCVQLTAGFALQYHTGRFSDGTLDGLLLRVGKDLRPGGGVAPSPPLAPCKKRQVLHVATEAAGIGGLSRTILNWARADRASVHHLFLTRQVEEDVPRWLSEAIVQSGGRVEATPAGSGLRDQAFVLREAAYRHADLVVLHHGGHDTLPVLAFSPPGGPPVAVLNHADHQFWMGSSVTDLVINQRELGGRLADRRHTPLNVTLPIPLRMPDPRVTRRSARRILGIPDSQLMLLSVGRALKFRPTSRHNFLRTARRILDRLPAAHLYVIGMTEGDAVGCPGYIKHERLHLCGPMEDPSHHRSAADLFLEPFPFGSATAVLETCLTGVPVVLPYAPPLDLLVTNHGLEGLVTNPSTEDEYIEHVCFLGTHGDERKDLSSALHRHTRTWHTGDGWLENLERAYDRAFRLSHTPRSIPPTCSVHSETDEALSWWHTFLRESWGDVFSVASDYALQAAYEARERGDYRAATHLLMQWHHRGNFRIRRLNALAKLPAHWLWQMSRTLV